MEALQGGLAGIAGGGGEDQDVLILALGGLGGGEQLGQHGKGHVLESRGGAPEQLQHMEITHGNGGGQVLGLELSGVGIVHQSLHIGDVRQQGGQNGGSHILGRALQAALPVQFGERFGHIQAAVGGQSFQDGLGAVNAVSGTAGGMIKHESHLGDFCLPIAQKTSPVPGNPLLFGAVEI